MVKKIMIVDDEPDMVELVKVLMTGEGFDVVIANNGRECLEKLKTERPDLILLDVMMPEMSGRETLKRIRSDPKTKDIKVALLTVVRPSESGMDIFKQLKASDYITKPFENDDLVFRVKKILKI